MTWAGLAPEDPPHEQPSWDLPGLASGREGGETDLGDLGVRDALVQLLVEDGLGVADLRPRARGNRRDGGGDSAVLAGGDFRNGRRRGESQRRCRLRSRRCQPAMIPSYPPPQALVVFKLSATSRVATITGARPAQEKVPSSAFNPLTPK
jgi:hypothetical protein